LSAADNHTDHLLQASFEFMDVNDSSSVNKIIDEAAELHLKKIADI
jgi:hypothetical protein